MIFTFQQVEMTDALPAIARQVRFVPLNRRFIFMSSVLLIMLLGCTAAILIVQQRISIRAQVEARGLAIARSLAASCRGALTIYNYIALEQTASEAAKNPDVIRVIIHDKEGRVAGYSGRSDLQGTVLNDEWTQRALASVEQIVQEYNLDEGRTTVLDCAVPVEIEDSDLRWGTLRVVVSLAPMYAQIRWTQWIIVGMGSIALALGILTAGWVAGRITAPLARLTQATISAAQGNLEQVAEIQTGDEVEILARNFNEMIEEILAQRRQLESQLMEIKHLQRYSESLVTTMNDGLLSVDQSGNIAVANPAAEELLKVDIKKGDSVDVVLESCPSLLDYLHDMLRMPEKMRQQEIIVYRQDKSQVILVNSSRLLNADGMLQELITNLHDVTELKQLEARIRQADRLAALGTLAAGMAHEIRNPLSAIKTFVQLLPRKLEKPGFLEKFNRTVPRELDRINRLVEDLLELSRDVRFRMSEVDVGNLLEETFELFEEEMKASGIDAQLLATQGLPMILADADQLKKAFYNLFKNAFQAMPSGGSLLVAASLVSRGLAGAPGEECMVAISFQDSGVGIPEENLHQIFNPFFTTKDNGTGLGLSITHKVIAEHDGSIDVQSSPGAGARFTLSFKPAGESRDLH